MLGRKFFFQIFTIYKAEDCETAIMLPSVGSIYKAEVCGTARRRPSYVEETYTAVECEIYNTAVYGADLYGSGL